MRDSQEKLLNQAEKIAEMRVAREKTNAHDQINVQTETSDIPSKTSSN